MALQPILSNEIFGVEFAANAVMRWDQRIFVGHEISKLTVEMSFAYEKNVDRSLDPLFLVFLYCDALMPGQPLAAQVTSTPGRSTPTEFYFPMPTRIQGTYRFEIRNAAGQVSTALSDAVLYVKMACQR